MVWRTAEGAGGFTPVLAERFRWWLTEPIGAQVDDAVAVALGERFAAVTGLPCEVYARGDPGIERTDHQVVVWRGKAGEKQPWIWVVDEPTLLLTCWWEVWIPGQTIPNFRIFHGMGDTDALDERTMQTLRRMNDATEGMIAHGLHNALDDAFALRIEAP